MKQLRFVNTINDSGNFEFQHNQFVYHQIGEELPNFLAAKPNRYRLLLLNREPLIKKG